MSMCKFHLAEIMVSVSCLAVPFLARCGAQEMFFPGTEWTKVAPEAELMDSAALEDAVVPELARAVQRGLPAQPLRAPYREVQLALLVFSNNDSMHTAFCRHCCHALTELFAK